MKTADIFYLCDIIANLTAVPIRVFKANETVFQKLVVDLPKDPALLYLKELKAISENVGYFVTPQFNYYGAVNHDGFKIVCGPTRQILNTDQELKEIAFHLDVAADDTSRFVNSMKQISPLPLETVLHVLCSVNFVLNGEKLTLRDIILHEVEQDSITVKIEEERLRKSLSGVSEEKFFHARQSAFSFEQALISVISVGDTEGLKNLVREIPPIRAGIMATNELRQIKNTFIAAATIASRAAISGGVDAEEAMGLSDSYIQKCELLNSESAITNLQYNMILCFTGLVETLRFGTMPTKLVLDVSQYIHSHISDEITVENIAGALFISRTHLSKCFKRDTNTTLTDFILKEKIKEAKKLLRYSKKPLVAISSYLNFSSQSHFTRVFKKYEGITPSLFRKNSNVPN